MTSIPLPDFQSNLHRLKKKPYITSVIPYMFMGEQQNVIKKLTIVFTGDEQISFTDLESKPNHILVQPILATEIKKIIDQHLQRLS